MIGDSTGFYDSDPRGYSERTFHADISSLRERFLRHMPDKSRILDLGCGSGRDTVAFREAGYAVVPVDGSSGMCHVAEENTGSPVRNLKFDDLDYTEEFDGVWACSSLLHVASSDLPKVISLIRRSLKDGGMLYMSFKRGDFEGERDGRHYTDMDEGSIMDLAASSGMSVVDMWTSREPGRDIDWINAILGK